MTIVESLSLGVIQGLSEFLPVSSSGHLVLGHALIGAAADDLAFDAVLHLATAAAIIIYFRRDIWKLIQAAVRLVAKLVTQVYRLQFSGYSFTKDEREVLVLAAGTVPAVLLGLFLEDLMATAFRNPLLVAVTLIVGALIMTLAERTQLRRRLNCEDGVLTVKDGVLIGLFQSLSLVPGMSRSGMTIVGGMFFGLSREAAARFGFLLGVPLLLGAGAKKILDLGAEGVLGSDAVPLIAGSFAAFISGILVIHYLLKFLRTHTLYPFIIYRMFLAAVIVVAVYVGLV